MPKSLAFTALLSACLFIAGGVPRARAQAPHIGLVTCGNCSAAADLPAASLFAFVVPSTGIVVEPNVLFDESLVGGGQVGGAAAPAVGSPLWSIPPNWRQPFQLSSFVAAIVLAEGTAYFDSSAFSDQDMGANAMQVLCAYPGSMAPLVKPTSADKTIEWQHLAELNNDDPAGVGCTLAGASVRGFVIGYDIYRLSVASFPNPTRRDFVVSGYLAHANLGNLDFTVPDPDGLSGSDRDLSDGLSLRNPDGLPDTGDEILSFIEAGAGSADNWYRVQPVVQGNQAYYDTGLSGSAGTPADRLDLNGDGQLDTVDIARDGFMDFIDPSGRGLGLTWAGEIASSFYPGRAMPAAAQPGCDGLPPPPAGESICGNGSDDDGDTLIDCLDAADCCGSPECMAMPPEIPRLDVRKVAALTNDVVVSWSVASPARVGAVQDVISGCISRRPTAPNPRSPGCLWQDRAFMSAACLADDLAATTLPDSRAIDATSMGIYYLAREQSACGVAGTWGSGSRGTPRLPGALGCAP